MKIRVNPHTVEIVKKQTEPINELEIKVSKCEFEFDEAITSDFVKEAYFTLNGNTYKQIIVNDECDYPSEVLAEKGTLEIGVVAFKVENDEEIIRYNPSPDYFESWVGSLKDAENSEPITPSEMQQFEQELQEGLEEVNDKLDDIDEALINVNEAITEVNDAIEETNNLNLDVSDKVGKDVTVTLTKKDATTKSVVISDGTSLQFMWQGTSLGIKTDDMSEYVFVDLQGQIGPVGPQGNPFQVKKTYATVDLMIADYDNMEINDYVMISGNIEQEDNAKLFVKTEQEDPVYRWQYLADFSGASGIQGPQGERGPQGVQGEQGIQGIQGVQGETGNGISSITKTATSGLVDTYTITFTNGQTTTYQITNGANGSVVDVQVDGTSVVDNGIANIVGISEIKQELEDMYNLLPKVQGTGETITLDGTVAGKMLVDLKGNTSQETTTGKNLANYSNWEQGNFYVEGAGINGNVESANVIRMNDFINVKPSTTYTLSCNTTIGQFGYVFKDTNGNITGAFQNTGTKYYTFTTPSNVNQIRLRIGNSSYPKTYGNNYQIQLEENNQATPYEEYTGGQPSPSPDYPQNIHVVSGNNTIKVEGKNLCNGIIQNYFVNQAATRCGYAVGDSGLIIEVDGTSDYTISSNTAQTRYRVGCLNEIPVEGGSNTIVYNSSNKDGTNDSVTINTNGYKYLVVNATDLSAIQIEKGSSASEFQPYQSQTYEINLGNIELCKIGDYQDRIYKDSGKWYLEKNIGKVESYNGETITTDYISTTGQLTTGAIVYYVLATPTTTEITDSTLLSQLEALNGAKSYTTQTNINQENNDEPFILDVTALKQLTTEEI